MFYLSFLLFWNLGAYCFNLGSGELRAENDFTGWRRSKRHRFLWLKLLQGRKWDSVVLIIQPVKRHYFGIKFDCILYNDGNDVLFVSGNRITSRRFASLILPISKRRRSLFSVPSCYGYEMCYVCWLDYAKVGLRFIVKFNFPPNPENKQTENLSLMERMTNSGMIWFQFAQDLQNFFRSNLLLPFIIQRIYFFSYIIFLLRMSREFIQDLDSDSTLNFCYSIISWVFGCWEKIRKFFGSLFWGFHKSKTSVNWYDLNWNLYARMSGFIDSKINPLSIFFDKKI